MGKKTILFVENHADTGELLAELLHQEGFEVKWFSTWVAVFETFNLKDCNLIVTNLTPFDVNNISHLMRVREVTDAPMLIISALHPKAIEQAAQTVNASGFLPKPFSLGSFIGLIKRIVK